MKIDTKTKKIKCDVCGKMCNGPIGIHMHQKMAHTEKGKRIMMAGIKKGVAKRMARNREVAKMLAEKWQPNNGVQDSTSLLPVPHWTGKRDKSGRPLNARGKPYIRLPKSLSGFNLEEPVHIQKIKRGPYKKKSQVIRPVYLPETDERSVDFCPHCGTNIRAIRLALNFKE